MSKPTQAKRRIALIDADSIVFAVAASGEYRAKGQGDNGEDLFLQKVTAEAAYTQIVERIGDIVFKVEAQDAVICLTDRENFRYGILPTYKGNRSAQRRPALLGELREMLSTRKPYPVMLVKGLEADDVCGIAQGSLTNESRETVICSPDKDLRTIPGLLFTCRMDREVEVITEAEADYWHLYQTLVGDTTDNYTGCPKVGPVKAKAILDPFWADLDYPAAWGRVVEAYTSRGFSEEYCLTQARTARILRVEDWDAEAKEVILWEPPKVVPIETQLGEAA